MMEPAVTDPGASAHLRRVHGKPRFTSLRTIVALILREMGTTYGRNPGGYAWAVLEPVLGVAVLVAVFSTGFRAPPIGSNFAIFYATGLMPFGMFMTTSTKVAQSINQSRQLLNYPRVTFLDAVLARFLLNVLTQGLITVIVFAGILMLFETRTILDLGRIMNGYAMVCALGLGVGMLNCVLISQHPIWNSVWSVITRPLVLISGVIFLHEKMPAPFDRWLEWNPLVHAIGEVRRGFYYSYAGDYVDPTYVYLVSVICCGLGLMVLRRYYRDMMER